MKTVQQILHEAGKRLVKRLVSSTQSSNEETDPVFLSTGGKYRSAHLAQSSAPQPTSARFHGPLVTFSAPLPSQQTLVNAMNAATNKPAPTTGEPTDEELDALLAYTPTGRAILADRIAARGEVDTSNQETPEYQAALNSALAAMHAQMAANQAQYAALRAEQEAWESRPEVIDELLATTPIGRTILAERGK